MIQNFDFRLEIRPENQLKFLPGLDPTLILEIMIETVNRSDMHEKIVGFAYFPLFLGLDGVNSPHSPEVEKFMFNEGAYQIPIFANRIAEGVDLTL